MKNIHPLRTALRKARRLEALGESEPMCIVCGREDPMQLRPEKRTLLEQHHPLGKSNDPDLTVPLCLNCHAEVTERLRQAGVSMDRQKQPISFASHVFRAFSVHFRLLSEACWKYARWMEQQNTKRG